MAFGEPTDTLKLRYRCEGCGYCWTGEATLLESLWHLFPTREIHIAVPEAVSPCCADE